MISGFFPEFESHSLSSRFCEGVKGFDIFIFPYYIVLLHNIMFVYLIQCDTELYDILRCNTKRLDATDTAARSIVAL